MVKRFTSHTLMALAEASLIALLVVGLIAGTALAGRGGGKPSGGGSYSVTVDQSGPYTFGQAITVSTNTPMYPNNTGPWIDLMCYQGSTKVLGTTHAGFPDGWYYGDPFWLGPTGMWDGGDADCTVVVSHQARNKFVTDATVSFSVGG